MNINKNRGDIKMNHNNEIINHHNAIKIENPIGGELTLVEVHQSEHSDKKYKEVFASEISLISGNITQGALQVANQANTLSQIAKQAPNGLFSASVNPSELSKFKNGTLTTMVRKGSKLEKHAGFTEVTISNSINPAMILTAGIQVMSMISGTYYLNQINSQITQIDNQLEELMKIHHDANIGKLIAARKGLSEIATRDVVDTVDINTIRIYKKTVDEIHEEYSYSLRRKENDLLSSKEVKENKLDDINFYMSIAFEASKLSLFAELIEIGLRMKIGGQDSILEGLTKQLESNYTNSFYYNIEFEVDSFYTILREKNKLQLTKKKKSNQKIDDFIDYTPAWGWGIVGKLAAKGVVVAKDKIDDSSAKKKDRIRKLKLQTVKASAENNKKNETIDDTIRKMIKLPNKESEILYIPDGDRQRVFVPVN